VRHGEHDVEVASVEQFLLSRLEPSFASLRLALRATAISTGVIRDTLLMAALETHVDVSAKRGAAAAQDGPECLQLLIAEAGLIAFQELIALRTEDVGHLHGGPAHGFSGRQKARRLSSTLDSVSSSSGFCTSCRCRCERWRYLAVVSRSSCPSSIWMVRKSAPASRRCVAKQCLKASSYYS
jgi:hypothetical protein